MARLTISMPDAMDDYVASQVETGQYDNVSEYFRSLVRRDQERENAAEELRRMLTEAQASGVSKLTADDIWKAAEKRNSAF